MAITHGVFFTEGWWMGVRVIGETNDNLYATTSTRGLCACAPAVPPRLEVEDSLGTQEGAASTALCAPNQAVTAWQAGRSGDALAQVPLSPSLHPRLPPRTSPAAPMLQQAPLGHGASNQLRQKPGRRSRHRRAHVYTVGSVDLSPTLSLSALSLTSITSISPDSSLMRSSPLLLLLGGSRGR
jgi:hypothetical protein